MILLYHEEISVIPTSNYNIIHDNKIKINYENKTFNCNEISIYEITITNLDKDPAIIIINPSRLKNLKLDHPNQITIKNKETIPFFLYYPCGETKNITLNISFDKNMITPTITIKNYI